MFLLFFSCAVLLCLTNAIRRLKVKSLSTGSPTQHYTPSDPRDWLDILRRKRFRSFNEKNVRGKLFSRANTFHLHEHEKDKILHIMINSTGWWMPVITKQDPRIFFFFDDIIFVFFFYFYFISSHSSSFLFFKRRPKYV